MIKELKELVNEDIIKDIQDYFIYLFEQHFGFCLLLTINYEEELSETFYEDTKNQHEEINKKYALNVKKGILTINKNLKQNDFFEQIKSEYEQRILDNFNGLSKKDDQLNYSIYLEALLKKYSPQKNKKQLLLSCFPKYIGGEKFDSEFLRDYFKLSADDFENKYHYTKGSAKGCKKGFKVLFNQYEELFLYFNDFLSNSRKLYNNDFYSSKEQIAIAYLLTEAGILNFDNKKHKQQALILSALFNRNYFNINMHWSIRKSILKNELKKKNKIKSLINESKCKELIEIINKYHK